MITNPFTSDTFTTIWSKHFCQSSSTTYLGFLKDLRFEKHKFLPLYFNYGKTHTKGISYTFKNSDVEDIDGKVLLIYDVPTFFDTAELPNSRIKRHKIKQYPGFLIHLNPYKDLNAFMVDTFKKSSRYKLKKYKTKLETCFDIHYKMFFGGMTSEEYTTIFDSFYRLLTKRFDDKQVSNNNLDKEEWDFYREVAYPMILEKKAGLFVVYNGKQPIGVTLCYFSDEILFDAITVFDIDYAKFHLGSVTIMKLIEWSIEHRLKIFDFSKGYFDYKKRWASDEYDFEYHILYDSKSLAARLLASTIKSFFEFKQYLRDKNVNEKLHKLTYKLRSKSTKTQSSQSFEFINADKEYNTDELTEIDYNNPANHFLKTIVFEYLYLKNEIQENIKAYKLPNVNGQFLFIGKDSMVRVNMITE